MLKTRKKLAFDIGISESYLKRIQREYLIENKHFFKKYGKIYFDEGAFFDWVKESKEKNGKSIQPKRQDLGKLVSQWSATKEKHRFK